MISLTRLNGERIAVNPDLIERAEQTPDTVLTLTNGTKYVVHETIEELVERIQLFRATITAMAQRMASDPEAFEHFHLHLVRDTAEVRAAGQGLDPTPPENGSTPERGGVRP